MPLKIIRKDHMEILGRGFVLLTATHMAVAEADLHTGQIVEEAALLSKCYALIGKMNRELLDSKRIQSVHSEFRKSIQTLVDEDGIRCVLDIRGKKEAGVDIGTVRGECTPQSTTEMVKTRLARDFKVSMNAEYTGIELGSIVAAYVKENPKATLAVEAIQIEFGQEERTFHREKVIGDIVDIVGLVNQRLAFSESDQGSGGALG